jgi:hypothetical protein
MALIGYLLGSVESAMIVYFASFALQRSKKLLSQTPTSLPFIFVFWHLSFVACLLQKLASSVSELPVGKVILGGGR